MAPAAEGVTILFTFLEGASKLKELGKEVAREALWRLQAVVSAALGGITRPPARPCDTCWGTASWAEQCCEYGDAELRGLMDW